MPTALTAFGAVGDRGADNAAAFVRAGASGESLMVPAGVFRSSVPLVLENQSATIIGEGPGRSRVERIGAGDAIILDLYADDHASAVRKAWVEGIGIAGAGGTGLSIRGTRRPLGTKMAVVRNVVVDGPFARGFQFDNCWGLRADTLLAAGATEDAYRLHGYCVDSTLTACDGIGAGFRVQFTAWGDGTPEGVAFYNCHALAAQHGLFYDARTLVSPEGTAFLCPWLVVDACHFNVIGRTGESSGITVHRGSALFLSNNLIFHVYPDNGARFHGIDLQGCADGRIAGNSIYTGSTHQQQVGIYAGGKALSFADNRLLLTHDGDVGIRVPAEAEDLVLAHNHAPPGRERQLYDIAPEATRIRGVMRPLPAVFGPDTWVVPSTSVEALRGRQDDGHLDLTFYVAATSITQDTPSLRVGLPGVVRARTQTVGHGWYHDRAAPFLISAHPGESCLRLSTLAMTPWLVSDRGVFLGGQIRVEVEA